MAHYKDPDVNGYYTPTMARTILGWWIDIKIMSWKPRCFIFFHIFYGIQEVPLLGWSNTSPWVVIQPCNKVRMGGHHCPGAFFLMPRYRCWPLYNGKGYPSERNWKSVWWKFIWNLGRTPKKWVAETIRMWMFQMWWEGIIGKSLFKIELASSKQEGKKRLISRIWRWNWYNSRRSNDSVFQQGCVVFSGVFRAMMSRGLLLNHAEPSKRATSVERLRSHWGCEETNAKESSPTTYLSGVSKWWTYPKYGVMLLTLEASTIFYMELGKGPFSFILRHLEWSDFTWFLWSVNGS